MRPEQTRFETEVHGIWGLWPQTPLRWSYSSLRAVEACASQWMLSRAEYPDIWDRHGYPPVPVVSSTFGSVVHRVVERLAKELGAARVTSPETSDAVGVLGSLGGWRAIVLEVIEFELAQLGGNPRVGAERLGRIRDELVRRAPEVADQVKEFLGHGVFSSVSGTRSSAVGVASTGEGRASPWRVGSGVYSELELVAEALRIAGRIDLLIVGDAEVDIIDFKTGAESDDHGDQVLIYALLWYLDAGLNPDRRLATGLHVVYPFGERAIEAPDREGLQSLADAVLARIRAADDLTRELPPKANPIEENCRHCRVRHLCEVYWSTFPPPVKAVPTEQWFDCEVRVLRQNGPRSWFAETLTRPAVEVLVRTVEADLALQAGRRVRLLGVQRSQDPDDPDRLVVSMVATSEWYPLGS